MSADRLADAGLIDRTLAISLNLGHNYIQTEHLFLAMTQDEDSVVVGALTRLGLTAQQARKAVFNELQARFEAAQPERTDVRTHGPIDS